MTFRSKEKKPMLLWTQTPDCRLSNTQSKHPQTWLKCLLGVILVVVLGTLPLTAWSRDFPGIGSKAKWDEAAQYTSKGIQEANKGDYASAEIFFKKALNTYDQDASFYFNLGYLYRKMNQFDKAENYYKHAVKMDPDYGKAWMNLGCIYDIQGRTQESLNAYKKSITCDLSPKDKENINSFISTLEAKLTSRTKGISQQ